MVIALEKAEYLGKHRLALTFDDGTQRTVDFGPFLKNAQNPMTTQFLDQAKFSQFILEDGDIRWGDYEMVFPIWDLYEGQL